MKNNKIKFWDGFVVGFICALIALMYAYSTADSQRDQKQIKTSTEAKIYTLTKGPKR